MPPKSQRSRACSQCRTRRVKCDETPEICNQCRRLGLQCSGPIQGSIVIDMTERVLKPKTKKKKETARAAAVARQKTGEPAVAEIDPNLVVSNSTKKPVTQQDMPLQSYGPPFRVSRTEEVEQAITAIRYHYRPPTFNQPTRALPEALDNAFITHYVELNVARRSFAPELQWIGHLQTICTSATKPIVKVSLRAVSMAFYGKYYNDSSITIDSWRWYTVALTAQRNSIAKMKRNYIPDEGEVLVPLMLALYELYAGATATGSTTHLNAAGEIMRMRGPSNCKSGAIWPLFKAVRAQDAHRCLIFNRISPYSSPEWLTIPFVDMEKDPHQALADIELVIPRCTAGLGIEGSLRAVFETTIPPNIDITPAKELACRLIADLENWGKKYSHLIDQFNASNAIPASGSSSQSLRESSPKSTPGSAHDILIGSNYMANGVILNMLMYKMQTESKAPSIPYEKDPAFYASEASKCSQNIIQFVSEIERAKTPVFDVLRSIAPLLTVAYCAPTMELRNTARTMVFRFTSKFSGIASVLDRM